MRIGVIHPGSMDAAVAMAARAGGAMIRGLAITTTVCAALGGCAQNPTTEPPRVSLSESLAPVPDPIDDEVGFAVREGGTWRPGDGVLYEITIEAGDERRRSFMRIETLGDYVLEGGQIVQFVSPVSFTLRVGETELRSDDLDTHPTRFELYDEHGARTSNRIVGVYTACLRQGYHATATAMRALEEDPDTPRDPEAFAGIAWIYLLGAGIQDESVARTYLKGLANMPPLYSYLLNMGLKVSIDWAGERTDGVWTSHDGSVTLPCLHQPVTLRLNGTDALTGRFTSVPDTPPLTTSGGIVEAHLWNPKDPERVARIRVIGAWHDTP